MKKIIIYMAILIFAFLPAELLADETVPLKYRFEYRFQMKMEGNLLLLVPYRFYYEAGASVNFKTYKQDNGNFIFYYDGIEGPGYVMSTGGLRASSLYFFTADYDLKRAESFREKKLASFISAEPYYSDNIRKIRRRPMKILSSSENSLLFLRNMKGVHSGSKVNMQLSDSHSFTYSNIYKILGQLIRAYNHPVIPEQGMAFLKQSEAHTWYGQPLNFSGILLDTVKLTSEDAANRAKFKQKRTFRAKYRIIEQNSQYISIYGDCEPNVKIRKKMKIHRFVRQVTLRLEDGVTIKDRLVLKLKGKKSSEGMVFLNLELREH